MASNAAVVALAVAVAAAALYYSGGGLGAPDNADVAANGDATQGDALMDDLAGLMGGTAQSADAAQQAFLDVVALSEGTYGLGDSGYNVLVGGSLFDNGYTDHPRILVTVNSKGLKSTAAGRYQILARTWDYYRAKLNLSDFSPASQDAVALQLAQERGAMPFIESGDIATAVAKCCKIWASFPGAGYPGQHTNSVEQIAAWYQQVGGGVA